MTRDSAQFAEFEQFPDLLEGYLSGSRIPHAGEVVKGKVVEIAGGFVTLDVGLKSEGRIALSEFAAPSSGEGKAAASESPAISIGDEVEVYIERIEGRGGLALLSREKAIKQQAWDRFGEIQRNNATIEGVIIGKVRGGMAVDLGGIVAFLPGSQIDIFPSRDGMKDLTPLISTRQQFKILKMDDEHGNVVVSHRVILEEARKEACDEFLSTISEGMEVEGTVKNMTGYGAFVTIGPVDALLHITDIAWHKISHPSDVLSIGQKLKLKVIKYNPELKRVSVGLKQLEPNPWESLKSKYMPGTKFHGPVTRIFDYGPFVELEPNVEGLVYRDEMHWTARDLHPDKLVKVGDVLEVMILDVDVKDHRISLSMKRCQPNAWDEFAKKYPVGAKINAVVKGVCDFGMFVIAADEANQPYPVNILIPLAEMCWNDPNAELKKYSNGDKVECLITNIEMERERVTASIKRLHNDELARSIADLMAKGSVSATITEVKKDGLIVEVLPGVSANVEKSELSKDRAAQKIESFEVGGKIEVLVTGFNSATRQATASVKALETARHEEAIQKYGSKDGGQTAMGEALGELLDN